MSLLQMWHPSYHHGRDGVRQDTADQVYVFPTESPWCGGPKYGTHESKRLLKL